MSNNKDKLLSTTQLSKKLGINTRDAFAKLLELGLIIRQDDAWALTDQGKEAGADYRVGDKVGRYIVWPESVTGSLSDSEDSDGEFISATKLGAPYDVSAQRINQILSELGWIEKGIKGWVLTKLGTSVGGLQKEHPRTGVPYVVWPTSVLSNKTFVDNINEIQGEQPNKTRDLIDDAKAAAAGFRDKFEAKLRTTDGHYVRSKAEMLIDNWLYMAEIVHAYERKLPIEEEVYCDFYIPSGKVYIEYWGYENDAKYLARKKKKQEIYEKYGFKLIELEDKDVQNLDDVLPKMLLKYEVRSF